jgi:hypothetical protein
MPFSRTVRLKKSAKGKDQGMMFDKSKRMTILLASGERLSIRAAVRRANKAKRAAKEAKVAPI